MELERIMEGSSADESFKAAVRGFVAGDASERIQVEGAAPRIKVQRLITQLLSSERELPITGVTVRARSGCSDFVGTVSVDTPTDTRLFDFVWDCRWRAEQDGWTDYFGLPDSARAAREYDWRCFQRWEQR